MKSRVKKTLKSIARALSSPVIDNLQIDDLQIQNQQYDRINNCEDFDDLLMAYSEIIYYLPDPNISSRTIDIWMKGLQRETLEIKNMYQMYGRARK